MMRLPAALLAAFAFVLPAAQAAEVIRTVDPTPNSGAFTSLRLNASGFPVIAYLDGSSLDLRLATCADATCTAPPTIVTIDSTNASGYFTALDFNASGFPVIAYSELLAGDLKLAVCNDAPCTAPTITTVEGGPNVVGEYLSMRLNAAGHAVISYQDGTTRDLKLALCTDATCSTPNLMTLDAVGEAGYSTSLALGPIGNPVISYFEQVNRDLKVVRCADAICSIATITTVDAAGDVGRNTSLALNASGHPVIAYQDFTNQTVKLAACADLTCATSTLRTIDSMGIGAAGISLQLAAGDFPVIAYQSGSSLRIAQCNNATCGAPVLTTIPNTGTVGPAISLQLGGSGAPVVAYSGSTITDVLKVATFTFPAVTSLARAGPNPTNAASLDYTLTFSEPVTGVDVADFTLLVTGAIAGASVASVTGGPTAWTVTVNRGTGSGTVRLTVADNNSIVGFLSMPLGGPASGDGNFTGETYTIDATPPAVTTVAVPVNGNYATGQNLDFTVSWDEAVTVIGTPRITLTIGATVRNADYVFGSGTTALLFRYTVVAADNDQDGIAVGVLGLNGGTIADAVGNNATLTLNALSSTADVLVNRTFQVTSTAGINGTIAPVGAQAIAAGATTTFSVTPNLGYNAVVTGCGGALVGTTYTTGTITSDCTVSATFTTSAITSYTAPSATGSGTIIAAFTGSGGPACTYTVSQYIPVTGHGASPPAGSAPTGIAFPHGLFDFRVGSCTPVPGASITMTITYPAALQPGTQYWKYGPTPSDASPHWYILPATIAGNTVTFTITDGGLGDDDLVANGTIVDQGGPGIGVGGTIQTPTMSQWMMALMALLMLLAASRRGSGRPASRGRAQRPPRRRALPQ